MSRAKQVTTRKRLVGSLWNRMCCRYRRRLAKRSDLQPLGLTFVPPTGRTGRRVSLLLSPWTDAWRPHDDVWQRAHSVALLVHDARES